MVSFETEVYHKQEEDVIGVKVIVVADNGQTIDTIHVVNESDFNELKSKLDVLNEGYVEFSEGSALAGKTIEEILSNVSEIANINATSLNGYQSDEFSKSNHNHVKSAITDLYTYDLTLSSYNIKIGDRINVTTKVLDSSNTPVTNHEVIIYRNGSLWKTGKTNAQGVFTTNYTSENKGLVTFQVNNQKIQCFVEDGRPLTLRQTITKNGATVKVYDDGFNVYIRYSGTVSIASKENKVIGTLNDLTYAPTHYTYGILTHMQGDIWSYGTINEAGNIYIINRTTSTSIQVYGLITYPLKSRIP